MLEDVLGASVAGSGEQSGGASYDLVRTTGGPRPPGEALELYSGAIWRKSSKAAKPPQPGSDPQRTAAADACIPSYQECCENRAPYADAVSGQRREGVYGWIGRPHPRRDRPCGGRAVKVGRRHRGDRAAGRSPRAEKVRPQR
eukprot:1594359-Pleurochrysis_carterae.AAC.2